MSFLFKRTAPRAHRSPRPGEAAGTDYYFLTRDEFLRRREAGDFAESAEVHGNLYGPPIAQVREKLAEGMDVLLKIDVQGAAKVRERVRDAVFIFLAPPSIEELVERLRARRTESEQELEMRVANAYKEMAALPAYDYVVVNFADRLDQAVDHIRCIITAERLRVQPRQTELL